jgi:IPT/TIG domain
MTMGTLERRAETRRWRSVRPQSLRDAAPRLSRLVPTMASVGDNLFIEGLNLSGGDLRVAFGGVETWALAIDDHTAFCIVPDGAAGPVSVSRSGLRSNPLAFGGYESDDPTRVLRVDPADGLAGTFRDTPVLARLSRPVQPMSLSAQTFRLEDSRGRVPGCARLSPDSRVVIWCSDRLLEPGVEHVLVIAGLRDERGRDVVPHRSRFVPSTLSWAELANLSCGD